MRITRGKWSNHEDYKCEKAVYNQLKLGETDFKLLKYKSFPEEVIPIGFSWKEVANYVRSRSAKQCRERFLNHLSPHINKDNWTVEEDEQLYQLIEQYSTKWKNICQNLPGRPSNMVKMRWRYLERRRTNKINKKQSKKVDEKHNKFKENYYFKPIKQKNTLKEEIYLKNKIENEQFVSELSDLMIGQYDNCFFIEEFDIDTLLHL